jgi:hypothetical protein
MSTCRRAEQEGRGKGVGMGHGEGNITMTKRSLRIHRQAFLFRGARGKEKETSKVTEKLPNPSAKTHTMG